jgi:L-alanine-DL-glutamate epimerase-like enolase superfamily enzyme
MKITGIEAFHLAIPFDHGAPKPSQGAGGMRTTMDSVYIRVDTDAGLTGWGEAFARGVYEAEFAHGLNISRETVLEAILIKAGTDPDAAFERAASEPIKARPRAWPHAPTLASALCVRRL